MSQYKYLTTQQERYLLLSLDTIQETIKNGVDKVYQWDLNREVNFIEKILTNRAYDMYYDADRLNSIKNLINYIEHDSERISILGQ